MNKAEKFIEDYTRKGSNIEYTQGVYTPSYHPWLTPDVARKAVKIARKEVIEEVCEYIASNLRCDGYTLQTKSKFINDLKQAMK